MYKDMSLTAGQSIAGAASAAHAGSADAAVLGAANTTELPLQQQCRSCRGTRISGSHCGSVAVSMVAYAAVAHWQ